MSDSWDSGGREADEEAGGSDDEGQGFPVMRAGEVGFRVQTARESEREERQAGTWRGGGFGRASEGIKRPLESRILEDGESSEGEGKSVAVEGEPRTAGADVGSSISAGSLVSSDAGGTETRGV